MAHAGMGTIITALEMGKPVIIMPRKASLKETRNEHQLATAKRFSKFRNIIVAFNEEELVKSLNKLTDMGMDTSNKISSSASPELISVIRNFIN